MADRQHKHRDLWVGLAVALTLGGPGISLGILSLENGHRHVGFWPHAGEVAGLALMAIGVFLGVAVVCGWWLPGGFKVEPAPPRDPLPAARSGLEVVIEDHHPMWFPGTAVILEIKFRVTNHDPIAHPLISTATRGAPLHFGGTAENDPEYAQIIQAYGMLMERARSQRPARVEAGATVHGVHVERFAWNPVHPMPDYMLIVKDGTREYEARPYGLPGQVTPSAPEALQPCYGQSDRYQQPVKDVTEHRIGIRNPAGNPEATGVWLEWTGISPEPQVGNEVLRKLTSPPQAVPRLAGGEPAVGISLSAGQEEFWLIASTRTDSNGVMRAGLFSPKWMHWRDPFWRFQSGGQWRLTCRIVADNLADATFSFVIKAGDGQIQCELEG